MIAHVFVTVSQTQRSGLPGRYAVSVRSAITSRNAGAVPAGGWNCGLLLSPSQRVTAPAPWMKGQKP